jgi:hypothetical protein
LSRSWQNPEKRMKNSEQPASWRVFIFTKPPSRRAQSEEPMVLDFEARAQDFLKRITTLSADLAAREYAKHWEARYLKLKSNLDYLSVEDFRLYQDMKRWHLDVGNMLSYINDVLVPHGFDEIVKDDFASLRQMLQQRR